MTWKVDAWFDEDFSFFEYDQRTTGSKLLKIESSDVADVGSYSVFMYATFGNGYKAYGLINGSAYQYTSITINDPCQTNTFKFDTAKAALYASV